MVKEKDIRLRLKLRTFINVGDKFADLSTCLRAKVSAIIFPIDFSAIYAIGYNGPSRGRPNDSCTEVAGECGCAHAEANALIKFNANIAKPSLMYTTHHPCHYCAGLVLNCDKLVGVIYGAWMRNVRTNLGIELLEQASLPTFKKSVITTDLPKELIEILRGRRC